MNFDSIILDVDGTIWNTTGIVAKAWNEAISKYNPEVKRVTAEILMGQFGKTMDVIASNLFPELSKEQQNFLIDRCAEYEQVAIENNTENITYKNVVSSIRELAKKVPLFIVSNCQAGYIELVMKKIDVEKCITDFECFGNNSLPKNENISLIVKRNNLKTPVYVGDTQGDADACKAAGVPFIWASYGFGKVEEYAARIDSFDELLKI